MYKVVSCCVVVGASLISQTTFAQQSESQSEVPPVVVQGANSGKATEPTPATSGPTSEYSTPTTSTSAPCNCKSCSCGCQACTAAKKKALKAKVAGAYKGVYYSNDFSYLEDPCYSGHLLGERAKRLCMPHCGKLDIGGQVRFRYHSEHGMKGAQRFLNTNDDFLLSRVRLFANYEVTSRLRVFAETLYADSSFQNYAPRGIDENSMDIQNLLLDYQLSDSLTVRVGRQELLYGAQRTVSPLDWANTRRTFEGGRLLYKDGDISFDAFFTALVPVQPLSVDTADWQRPFYGFYGTYAPCKDASLDVYYLGLDDRRAGVASSGRSLHTVGTRAKGKRDEWLFEVEAALQFGKLNAASGSGTEGFVTAGIGRPIADMPWKPTVWLYCDYASQNYNQIYPLAHKYLGFIDAVQRTNVLSPNVLVTAKPSDKLSLLMWYYYMASPHAGNALGIGNQYAQNPANRDLGQELDLLATYKFNARTSLGLGYSHFWRGSKIVNPDDADFFYTQLQMDF